MGIFKNYNRVELLFPLKFEYRDLKNLLEFCKEKVNEAKDIQIKTALKANPQFSIAEQQEI